MAKNTGAEHVTPADGNIFTDHEGVFFNAIAINFQDEARSPACNGKDHQLCKCGSNKLSDAGAGTQEV